MESKQWVVLENGEPHTLLLTKIQAYYLVLDLEVEFPLKDYRMFYDEYYEYIDYYSEEEREQINRLIP